MSISFRFRPCEHVSAGVFPNFKSLILSITLSVLCKSEPVWCTPFVQASVLPVFLICSHVSPGWKFWGGEEARRKSRVVSGDLWQTCCWGQSKPAWRIPIMFHKGFCAHVIWNASLNMSMSPQGIEKDFKKEVHDLPNPVVSELYKLFRRRPRFVTHLVTNISIMLSLWYNI